VKFALETRTGRPAVSEFVDRLVSKIESSGSEVLVDVESAPGDGEFAPGDGEFAPDVVVAVGGDGTMLAAVRRSVAWDVPVLGFNLGTLGFLTEAEATDIEPVVARLISGDFDVEERMTVAATVDGTTALGLNDVVVEKIDTTRLVSLDVVIDGTPFTTYRADGLVVATPTGSTAYSFSAGGPLVAPGVDVVIMTPVASHSLFDRSLVLPSSSKIDITVSRDRLVKVNVDKGALGQLGEGETVRIERGDRPARFVSFGASSFPTVVRDKFGLD